MEIKENFSLLSHNTFGIDVSTRWFISYDNEDELKKVLSDEYFLSQSVFHIGEGSNLLFFSDYEGIILHSKIQDMEILEENSESVTVKVGAGTSWDTWVEYAVSKSWGGMENLSGIPGEVGASAVQNIGAYGCEVKDVITEVEAYDIQTGEKQIFSCEECKYSYRESIFKKNWKGKYIITHVIFRLSKKTAYNLEYGNLKEMLSGCEINLRTIRNAVISIRESKLPDPKKMGNAGSFFMNPMVKKSQYDELKKKYPSIPSFTVSDNYEKIPAAWLIDQCGLKGFQSGNVAVHDKQPLVLVNKGGAVGEEIFSLAQMVQKEVKEKFGIEIVPEVTYVL